MSWNCDGILSSQTHLHEALYDKKVHIALIQETLSTFVRHWEPPPLEHYHCYSDKYAKTTIYVHETVRHKHIPLDYVPHSYSDKIHQLHATAILAYLQVSGSIQPTVLLNLYRSPNGTAKITTTRWYLAQIQQYLIRNRIRNIKYKLISGDLNAEHPAWGGTTGTNKKHTWGRNLYDFMRQSDFTCLNTGKPTRIFKTTNRHSPTGWGESYIDTTWAQGFRPDNSHWFVNPHPTGSDHLQIFLELPTVADPTITEQIPTETTWRLTNKKRDWDKYEEYLATRADAFQCHLKEVLNAPDSPLSAQEKCNEMTTLTTHLLNDAARAVFGRKDLTRIWPRWVSKKGEKFSIQFNRYWRKLRRIPHPTPSQFKRLRILRQQRNREYRKYRTRWMEKKFCASGLCGKDGWSTAAAVRDLNVTKGRLIPDIYDPKTNDPVATTIRDKVEYMNNFYHRHSSAPKLDPSYCWDSDDIIHPDPQPVDIDAHRDHPDQEPTNLHVIHTLPHSEDDYISDDDSLHNQFTEWITRTVHHRWTRCQPLHNYYHQMLNSPITQPELLRATKSFSNHKATGPDQIHITFLKKRTRCTLPILHTLLNTLWENEYIPTTLKERWITPVIKVGKTGNYPKELRPVSLTSYIGKVFEKLLQYRLLTYLVRLQLISAEQFAYIPSRSTQDCIIFLVDRLQRTLNKGLQANAVFFDFSSAFDTVQHQTLLWKLQHEYFITGRFLNTLRSFLSNRRTAVKIGSIISTWQLDTVGVPQGGALSPLLYVIYCDHFALINCLPNTYLGIFADDLCLFTDAPTPKLQQSALQRAIYFLQWYSLQHGLCLNFDKTFQMVFKRHNLNDHTHPPLHFSSSLHNHFARRYGLPSLTENKSLKFVTQTKYLGVILNMDLTWKPHIDYVEKKCYKAFYTLNKNLKRLWRIHADIPWLILETSVLSIMDYSSILWPLLNNSRRKQLNRVFNRVLRTVFHSVTGTNTIFLQHHLNTPDLNRRMALNNSKFFSRLIRCPRSGALHQLLERDWWPVIQARNPYFGSALINDQIVRASKPRPIPHFSFTNNTVLLGLIDNAIQWINDDLLHIGPTTALHDLRPRISYYVDLTKPQLHLQWDSRPFIDDNRSAYYSNDELFVFTDGSAKNLGGHGWHIVFSEHYWSHSYTPSTSPPAPLVREKQIDAYEQMIADQKDDVCNVSSSSLGTRCNIEFCEAQAIEHALAFLADQAQADPDSFVHNVIRVIADSRVVLYYILGFYRISNPVIKTMIDNIHWSLIQLHRALPSLDCWFQWTHSHHLTIGNDYSDRLADIGRIRARYACDNPWDNISVKAAANRSAIPIQKSLNDSLRDAVSKSQYGYGYGHRPFYITGITWHRRYRTEIGLLSRDSARILLCLRSGKDRLPWYLATRFNAKQHHGNDLSPYCSCTPITCQCPRNHCICSARKFNMQHLLTDCSKPTIMNRRVHIRRTFLTMHHRLAALYQEKHDTPWKHKNDFQRLDFNNVMTYTDPPLFYPQLHRLRIMQLIINFYRLAVGYKHYRLPHS